MGWALVATVAAVASAEDQGLSIYFHDVPTCAREEAERHVLGEHTVDEINCVAGPTCNGTAQMPVAHRLHLRGMLRQISAVDALLQEHRVADPREALLFYIPAFFPLLFWLGQDTSPMRPQQNPHLSCINETLIRIGRSPWFARRAGYDHLIVYGYEYPHWKRLDHLVLDSYSPFVGNMLVLTVSFWSQGRRAALHNAGLYALLRMVVIPYFTIWDCGREAELLQRQRDIAVAFMGSLKNDVPYFVFRERLFVSATVTHPRFANDASIYIEMFPADDALRSRFARDYEHNRAALYARSRFCLVMPGDGNTAGRLFDVMVAGCVPVLLFHPDSYPVLPFTRHIPWSEIAVSEPVANEFDVAVVLERLLTMPRAESEAYRRQTVAYAPLVALGLTRCEPGAPSALSLIATELRDRVRLLRTAMMPALETSPRPTQESHWLLWGPAFHSATPVSNIIA